MEKVEDRNCGRMKEARRGGSRDSIPGRINYPYIHRRTGEGMLREMGFIESSDLRKIDPGLRISRAERVESDGRD